MVRTSPGAPEGDLLAVQADDAIPAAGLLDVVRGDQQDPALRPQLTEHGLDPRGAGGVDARQRLVEQQHAGVLEQRAGDQDALALAAGQRAEPPACAVGEADAVERIARRVALGARERAPGRRAAVGAHQHDVERADREVEPGPVGLRHVGRPALELDLAAAHGQLAEHGAEQRGLAAAVGAEDGRDRARLEREVHAGQHLGARRVAAAQRPRPSSQHRHEREHGAAEHGGGRAGADVELVGEP